MNAAWNTQQ